MSAIIKHIGSTFGSRGGIRSVSGFGGGSVTVTFDAAASDPDVTLSNGNLTAGSTNNATAVSTRSVAGGKRYFQATFNADSSVHVAGIGFASTSFTTTTVLGEDTGSASFSYTSFSTVRFNQASINFGATYTVGDIAHIAVDFTVSPVKVYYGVNGTWAGSQNPAAGTNGDSLTGLAAGPYLAAVGLFAGDQFTANFATGTYLPSGYSTWST